jgi:VanZ family protein
MAGSVIHSLRFRRSALAVYWTLMFLGTHIPRIDRFGPESLRLIPHFDKFVHAGMFFGWILCCCSLIVVAGRKVSGLALACLFAGGAVYAALDEITQAYVGRDPELTDFLADLTGMALAILAVRLWQRRLAARQVP